MGWSLSYDTNWQRDIGYGVPAYCDHPGCGTKIDRGLAHVCAGEEPFGGNHGCGLYFCSHHRTFHPVAGSCCIRCRDGKPPFQKTEDHPEWIQHKLSDPSWAEWRASNPATVRHLKETLTLSKLTTPMHTHILYHANCTDGFGAALAAWLKYGDSATYIPVSYNDPVPDINPGSRVLIVDFSYPADVLELMASTMAEVVVLDHHATAQEALSPLVGMLSNLRIIFDMEKSGAVLAWEFFHETPTPDFFLYLQDRDLWQFRLPHSREVSAALRSYPFDFQTWALFVTEFTASHGFQRMATEGHTCIRLTEQQVAHQARHYPWMSFRPSLNPAVLALPEGEHKYYEEEGDIVAPVVNATCHISEVAAKLLELEPTAKFAACFTVRSDGRRQFSLRSRPDFDCSVIAKAFGGGGHKQACGFIL